MSILLGKQEQMLVHCVGEEKTLVLGKTPTRQIVVRLPWKAVVARSCCEPLDVKKTSMT
jgi:hypothetical protein